MSSIISDSIDNISESSKTEVMDPQYNNSSGFSLDQLQLDSLAVFSFISLLSTMAIIIIYMRSDVKKTLAFKQILMLSISDFGYSLFRLISSFSSN